MDFYGHVNNVAYLTYLEEARIALLAEGARKGVTSLLGDVVVVRHEIDYHRPLVFRPEPVMVEIWVTDIRTSSHSLSYEVRDESTVYAAARTVIVAYDTKADRTRPLTAEERSWLETLRDTES